MAEENHGKPGYYDYKPKEDTAQSAANPLGFLNRKQSDVRSIPNNDKSLPKTNPPLGVNGPQGYIPYSDLYGMHQPTSTNLQPIQQQPQAQQPLVPQQQPLAPLQHQPLPQLQLQLPNPQQVMQMYPPQAQAQSAAAKSRGRLRVSKACDRCRTQKIKCSGTNPCTTCMKHHKDCTFSSNPVSNNDNNSNSTPNGLVKADSPKFEQPPFKKQRVELNTIEPMGLPVVNKDNRRDYVAHLENRVQYLEKLLSENAKTSFKEPFADDPPNKEINTMLINPSSKWRFSRRHQNSLIVDLCRSIYETLPELLKSAVSVPRTQYFGWNMSGGFYLTPRKLPDLPELDSSLDTKFLIDFYFEEINPLFAILHETVFKEQIEVYNNLIIAKQSEPENGETKTLQTKLFTALLYLVYTLAIRLLEMQKPKTPNLETLKLEDTLFKYSYSVISILSFEWESFELIQGWLLITLYLRIAHRQTSMFQALSRANNITKAMGLGQEKNICLDSTPYERLKAKRIFWSVYTMDRVMGIQTGKYNGFRDDDRSREFPSLDYFAETQRDDWITLPAFAMIHIARIGNFVHTSELDVLPLVKVQQMNRELVVLFEWLNNNGFNNDDLFKVKKQPDIVGYAEQQRNRDKVAISSLVKAQVKLHYYDITMSIHGKCLFQFLGRKASPGLKVSMVIDACKGIIEVVDKIHKAGLLFTPWNLILVLTFNAGISAVALIQGGAFIVEARKILKDSTRLLYALMKSPIRNDKGKIIVKHRFTMVKECMWALKLTNHIMSLRLQEDLKSLEDIGIDHGSSEVNIQNFVQLGKNQEKEEVQDDKEDEFNKLLAKQLHRSYNDTTMSPTPGSSDTGYTLPDKEEETKETGDINLLGNLQWFDQWLDFEYDF